MAQGMILTNGGRTLLAKALIGKTLLFTRAAVGNGDLGSRDPKALTGLISYKKDLPIQQMNIASSIGTAEVVLEMSNKNLTQGFFVKEYGLFAKDPDTNAEVLYSYRNTGNESGYLEADNGYDIIRYAISIVTVIDQAPNVSATITNTNQYVTVSRMEQRVMDIYGQAGEVSGFWTFTDNDSERIRPATLAQSRQALLGNADLANMTGRLERLEDSINQMALTLEVLQGHDDQYSHFMAEDFADTSMLDMFIADVTSVVSGDDSIDVAPIEGMIPGCNYTLTDGTNWENVQVESINLENGVQRVILAGHVSRVYASGRTKIFRTNALIEDQEATAVQANLKHSWTPSLVWKGTAESEAFTITPDTTESNAGSFTMTGEIVLNNAGLITLNS